MANASYVSTLSGADRTRYIDKIKLFSEGQFNESTDPYQISDWTDDIELWPSVEFGAIYTYLIDTKGEFTREKLKAYKSLEAYNYYIR